MPQIDMIHVRHVTPADREEWLRMRRDLWPEGSAAEHQAEIDAFFAGPLREPLAVLIASDDSGRTRGFAELSIRAYAEGCQSDRVGYLEGWYVVPEARRSGVGRALIEGAEAWAVERGCPEFASDTLIVNEVSEAAHHALGFEEVEQVRCFWKSLKEIRSAAPAANPVARVNDIVVRHATIADSDALARLVTELGYPTAADRMRGRLEAILSKPEYFTVVAEVDERIAGFIGTMVRPSYEADGLYGQIMALVVGSQFRRRSVGRTLIGAVESSLARRGINVLIVNTANHRADAHAFYEALGYTFTGRRYRKSL
jgi:aminoglycoside 6'-N-acetyltransferase I